MSNRISGAAGQVDSSNLPRMRGKSRKSLDLIDAMAEIAETAQPITGRGIGYKLFTANLIPSMARSEMARVYRLLRQAREEGIIPWDWIVDETRRLERKPSWSNPAEFADCASRQYRRDFWEQQPLQCQVWSEKGTVRGVVAPVLNKLGVGFMPVGGFSATKAHDLAWNTDQDRDLIVIYIGDYDPSGMFMSERDLPNRMEKYEGDHVEIRRVALVEDQLDGLPSFPASDKSDDTRYPWFVENYGDECWELDALDPNVLRGLLSMEIKSLIEPTAWARCEAVNLAERNSLCEVLTRWAAK